MKIIILLLSIAILSGCVSQNAADPDFLSILDGSINDPSYAANSIAESVNSGGRFVTSLHFDVQDGNIIDGTVNKYSVTRDNESNVTVTLVEYKKNNEFWSNEFHTQKEIHEKVKLMLLSRSFVLDDIRCFRLQNNNSVETIRLDANVCFDKNSIALYSERSDYGRGGYYYWYKDGYENIAARLKQMGWE